MCISGCAPKGSLTERPSDRDSGRALARTVAEQARCDGFEDYDVTAPDAWEFTCQAGEEMFVIRAASTRASRNAAIPGLTAAHLPYRTGRFFVVWPLATPGMRSSPRSLDKFPGDLPGNSRS